MSSPEAAAPATLTVSPVGKSSGDGPLRRSTRRSLSASGTQTLPVAVSRSSTSSRCLSDSIDASAELARYTVHIPPTPDRTAATATVDAEPALAPERSYVCGIVFTGGLNCPTRGHVVNFSNDGIRASAGEAESAGLLCKMRGCDMPAFLDAAGEPPCACGFLICRECHMDCITGTGHCPGCKEPYGTASDEEEAAAELPPTSMVEFGSAARGGAFSMVHSMKKPADFDHARWLFETKGTYGYGNALWRKDGGGCGGGAGFAGFDEPPDFNEKCCRPLTRKTSVSQAILSPYRLLMVIRLVALGFFLPWRIRHVNHEAVWLWAMSVTCEVWFAFSWLLEQLPKLCPVNRATDLSVLKELFESPSTRNPMGRSDLPGIDVFVSTADPEKEPPIVTANTIL